MKTSRPTTTAQHPHTHTTLEVEVISEVSNVEASEASVRRHQLDSGELHDRRPIPAPTPEG